MVVEQQGWHQPLLRVYRSPTLRSIALWSAQILFCLIASWWMYGQLVPLFELHNDFPTSYHPDEWGKATQLLSDERNFRHPQLMLEVAKWSLDNWPAERGVDSYVLRGRQVSAWFAAGTGVLLAWAGFFSARWRGFVLVAVGAALCPAVLSHAKYFKEDSALAFGVACMICGGAMLCRARRARRSEWMVLASIAMGAGVGVAASAKYSGVALLVPAILLALIASLTRRTWWGLIPVTIYCVVSSAAAMWAWINWRAIEYWQEFLVGFNYEKAHGLTAHIDITLAKPTGYFADLVWREAMPHVIVLSTAGLACMAALVVVRLLIVWRGRKAAKAARTLTDSPGDPSLATAQPPRKPSRHARASLLMGAWLLLTAGAYLYAISYSSIPFYRYAMPVSLLLYTFAALAVAYLAELAQGRRWWIGTLVALAGVGLIAWVQGQRCADYTEQFAHDSRDELREWARDNLPPRSIIVVDWYSELQGAGGTGSGFRMSSANRPPIPAVIRNMPAWIDSEAVEDLRRQGVQYVAVVGTNYERYTSPYTLPVEGAEEMVEGKRAFYTELFAKHEVAWSKVAQHPMWVFANPDITVFKLPPYEAPKRTARPFRR